MTLEELKAVNDYDLNRLENWTYADGTHYLPYMVEYYRAVDKALSIALAACTLKEELNF